MKNLKHAGYDYLLEESLEALHRESQIWSSELKLWEIELAFFQKLLDRNSQNFTSNEEKKKMGHFQNLVSYYTGEVLDRFDQKIKQHEKYLAGELANKEQLDESVYRKKHAEIASHIGAFRIEFIMYKREFFNFIERVM
ncbi:MAG: hypothetical protein ABJF11_12720 [Reichenbachiella sp.]|uniref:hypothetical protein n=1 Tax=Reichenbachiella sp. TaxID=2184521 RepID=UPI0032651139